MTTITIKLSDDMARRLAERAEVLAAEVQAAPRLADRLAGAFVARGIEEEEAVGAGWDPSLTPDDIAAIERGIADAAAGRVRPWEEVREEMRALVGR